MIERHPQIHQVQFGPVVITQYQGYDTAQVPVELGYIDLNQNLAARFGRNMLQASVYRVAGLDVLAVYPGTTPEWDVGFAAAGQVNYISPTGQRVRAHKHMAHRWLSQARLGANAASLGEPARGRQFYVKYDPTQPSVGYHSTFDDDAAATDVEFSLIGTAGAATAGVVFDTENENYPAYPAASDGEDQRLYTRRASEEEEGIPWFWSHSQFDHETTGPFTEGGQIVLSSWRPPGGRAVEVMCGIMRVFLRTTTPARTTTQDPDTATMFLSVWVEGWRALR